MPKYRSTKQWGHNIGLSCCFRQWHATHSHCKFLHGYAIAVKLTFESDTLDDRNWVVDFGSLGGIKEYLQNIFDHKTVVAQDDPKLTVFEFMERERLIQLIIVDHVGCEAFAELIAKYVQRHISSSNNLFGRVKLISVEVKEHDGNSALFFPH